MPSVSVYLIPHDLCSVCVCGSGGGVRHHCVLRTEDRGILMLLILNFLSCVLFFRKNLT